MAATAQIQLGEQTYTVRRFTLGEIERVVEAIQTLPAHHVPFQVLYIAMERADPKVADPKAIEAEFDEVQVASHVILVLAGLREKGAVNGAGGPLPADLIQAPPAA